MNNDFEKPAIQEENPFESRFVSGQEVSDSEHQSSELSDSSALEDKADYIELDLSEDAGCASSQIEDEPCPPARKSGDTLTVISFVMGILTAIGVYPMATGVAALITGIIQLKREKNSLAKSGVILAIVGLVRQITVLLIVILYYILYIVLIFAIILGSEEFGGGMPDIYDPDKGQMIVSYLLGLLGM